MKDLVYNIYSWLVLIMVVVVLLIVLCLGIVRSVIFALLLFVVYMGGLVVLFLFYNLLINDTFNYIWTKVMVYEIGGLALAFLVLCQWFFFIWGN